MLKFAAPTLLAATVAATIAIAAPALANHHKGDHPMVGGAAMYPAKTIVENASAAGNLKTLVAAVKAAGLVDTLASPGPFTVFAPTDDAFAKLPAGTVETLVKPENKATLTSILTYHVVAGKVTAADVVALIKKGGGKAMIKTVQGGTLTASLQGQNVVLTDAKGGKSIVTQTDVMQSNGVVHVIDTVVMPG
ncbi:fasciclin domain-containing protein [Sphingomonas sp. 35-24ZXX]|uniref:fasciclin domain-containing protein n=1 Tax=Sphingomonas sp. 35-24ZXX TaxID=1545915 RepID=UPI00053BD966|nr:fasciclin domain-containing protein [Sphingomonas sp. 35-24ZXX]